ncbi:hypothetical protein [Halobacterium jilantaiense]|uniref:Uncharacterized protein n=1 Tax=Halobacterium jilantaiense TaxID=355548 RepID=A0A1I0NC10_9EURY|nr:hypothetical protein [Halobacterium jilantaiense]SEV98747.1 hypothetical protein SAMN04487945_0756 [Halobacterium jilantaiense]
MTLPTRRAALAVAVAALLATAGCLGGLTPTDTSSSPTNDTQTCTYDTSKRTIDSGTWSPDASVEQYPPGVADNGTLVNASTLLDAHFAVVANTSMQFRLEATIGDTNETRVRTLTHGPERTPFYSTLEEGPEGERLRTEFYRGDSNGFARVAFDNETRHIVYQNATTAGISAWTGYDGIGSPQNSFYAVLEGGSYSVNGTVERGDRTFVQLTTSEDSLDTGHITNGTVLVTPEGVIYDVDATVVQLAGEDDERRNDISNTLTTDVEWCGAPSWVDSTPHLSLSIVEDNHTVEIRNTGGAAVPANTSFELTGSEDPELGPGHPSRGDVKGTVATDERLEPGDTVYVTAGADGSASSFALHDDPTRGEYTFGSAGLTGVHGNVSYRLSADAGTYPFEES